MKRLITEISQKNTDIKSVGVNNIILEFQVRTYILMD